MVNMRIGEELLDDLGVVRFCGGFGVGSPREFSVIEPAVTVMTAEELQERERIEQELGAGIVEKLNEMIRQSLQEDLIRATASSGTSAPGSVCAACGGVIKWGPVPCPDGRPGCLVGHCGLRCVECGAAPDGDG